VTERELATDTIGNNVVQSNKKWWTLIVVSAATFMLLMEVTVVIVRDVRQRDQHDRRVDQQHERAHADGDQRKSLLHDSPSWLSERAVTRARLRRRRTADR
jgi:hypothetical protein